MMTFRDIFCLCLLICIIDANPQQNTQLLNDRIQNVFGSANTGNRGGFGEIVQPEPENLAPTQTPQILNNNNGQSCKCVPYWSCEPSDNPATTTDSRFFGEIDIR